MAKSAFLTAAFIFLLAPLAQCEQFELKVREAGESPYLECVRRVPIAIESIKQGTYKPVSVAPDLTRSVSFARLSLASGVSFTFLLDPAKVPVLFVDTNHNDDFTDDRRYEGSVLPKGKSAFSALGQAALFGPVALPLQASESAAEVQVFVEVYSREMIIVYPALVAAGEVAFGSSRRRVAAADANLNGSFDDAYPDAGGYDLLALDRDRDGKFDGQGEMAPLTRVIGLGDGFHRVGVTPDGSAMMVDKAEVELGTAVVESPGTRVDLISANGFYALGGSTDKLDLPVGKYLATGLNIVSSEGGDKWTIKGVLDSRKPLAVEIEPGATVALNVGPPLTPKLDVTSTRDTVSIGLSCLLGKGGEAYSAVVDRNGARATPPKLKILDEDGKVLASGSFAYG